MMSSSCIYFRHRLWSGCGTTAWRGLWGDSEVVRAAGCENEVALRYLTANQQPDFRKEYLSGLEELFVEVLGLCIEAGLVKLGQVALDGRKVAGNASLDQNRNEEWLQEEVAKLLAEAERVDEEEDAQCGEERKARVEAAKKTKANVTDPESQIMKTRRGWVQGVKMAPGSDLHS